MNDDNTPQHMTIDRSLFQRTSLIPILALIGLGADGLSSSCYGPEEAFLALPNTPHLILYVALLSVITIAIISASYCQIIELFPRGGGGYLVASKLLSPFAGLVSGCALLVDYVMTVTISIAAGVDAFLSIVPTHHHRWGVPIKIAAIAMLTLINLRGVRESVLPWIPIFLLFVITHLFAILWSCFFHADAFPVVLSHVAAESASVHSSVGLWGLLFLIARSFSQGAGTFTGIEAVSNGMSIIRAPKVKNAKRTMVYIAISLSTAVFGLALAFLLNQVSPQKGQTINAVLMGRVGEEVGGIFGNYFQAVALFSETALLFVAAQTGFLGGPQILSNMALDRWFPYRFVSLSDRFVMRRGILLIAIGASSVMLYAHGNVDILVILYSLSVFITFSLSQIGMVRHWWQVRKRARRWLKKLLINGLGALVSVCILTSLILIKFTEGAWLSLVAVTALVCVGLFIRRYYAIFAERIERVHWLIPNRPASAPLPPAPQNTAVMMLSGIHGMTQHSIANVLHLFGTSFDHFVFLHVGLVDAGNFKGESEVEKLKAYVNQESEKLVTLMQSKGYRAEAFVTLDVDIADGVERMAKEVLERYSNAVFIGGQLVLPQETAITRWLHNQTLHTIQRRLYANQYPLITVPIYFDDKELKVMAFNPIKTTLFNKPSKALFTALPIKIEKSDDEHPR